MPFTYHKYDAIEAGKYKTLTDSGLLHKMDCLMQVRPLQTAYSGRIPSSWQYLFPSFIEIHYLGRLSVVSDQVSFNGKLRLDCEHLSAEKLSYICLLY